MSWHDNNLLKNVHFAFLFKSFKGFVYIKFPETRWHLKFHVAIFLLFRITILQGLDHFPKTANPVNSRLNLYADLTNCSLKLSLSPDLKTRSWTPSSAFFIYWMPFQEPGKQFKLSWVTVLWMGVKFLAKFLKQNLFCPYQHYWGLSSIANYRFYVKIHLTNKKNKRTGTALKWLSNIPGKDYRSKSLFHLLNMPSTTRLFKNNFKIVVFRN